MYILEGAIENEGFIYEPKQLLVAKNSSLCEFVIQENTTICIFGGEPFPEERLINWNFVSSFREKIEEAKYNWLEQNFPEVAGETDFVPLPEQGKNVT